MKLNNKFNTDDEIYTNIAVNARFSTLNKGKKPPFGVQTSGPTEMSTTAYQRAYPSTSQVAAPIPRNNQSIKGNNNAGTAHTYTRDQYKYYIKYSHACFTSPLPKAGPIKETTPIENATGNEVQVKYSIGENTDQAAKPASFKYFPTNIEFTNQYNEIDNNDTTFGNDYIINNLNTGVLPILFIFSSFDCFFILK